MINSSNIKQQITKPGDIKMNKKAAQAQKQGLAKPKIKKGKAGDYAGKVTKKNMGGGLSPSKAKELNNIMNASQGIAENLQKQSMVRRKRGGIIDGNNLVSSYYE